MNRGFPDEIREDEQPQFIRWVEVQTRSHADKAAGVPHVTIAEISPDQTVAGRMRKAGAMREQVPRRDRCKRSFHKSMIRRRSTSIKNQASSLI